MKSIAFIPARSGSKRVKDKNIRLLGGKPLLYYSIKEAIKPDIFQRVILVTDSLEYAKIAKSYGAEAPFLRPPEISGDESPDFAWLSWILEALKKQKENYELFSILRPTSPFRTAATIRRVYQQFTSDSQCDSLRAGQKVKEHPVKMWVNQSNRTLPILPYSQQGTPFHSSPYDTLPEILIQNASLEMAWVKAVEKYSSISGQVIMPLFTEGLEGFDINNEEDFWLAERFFERQKNVLRPEVDV